jgi:hypothetical protein
MPPSTARQDAASVQKLEPLNWQHTGWGAVQSLPEVQLPGNLTEHCLPVESTVLRGAQACTAFIWSLWSETRLPSGHTSVALPDRSRP